MTKSSSISTAEAVSFVVLALGILTFSYPYFFYALDDFREIVTYNLDSASILRDIREAINAPGFQLNFTTYGQLFYNICIGLGYLYSRVAHLGDHQLFFIIRLVTWTGGMLSLAVTYVFVRRYIGRIEAIFAVATLIVFPVVLFMSIDPHPDTWQMFFMTLSLYYSARAIEEAQKGVEAQSSTLGLRADAAFVLKATAAAGAAFSTKYVGVMLLPLLALLAMSLPPMTVEPRRFGILLRWLGFAMALLALPLIIFSWQLSSDLVLQYLPEWRALPEKALMNIARLFRWVARLVGVFCLVIAVAVTAGYGFQKYTAWFTKGILLVAMGVLFAAIFVVTSPWAAYHLRFFPDVYTMSMYVNFGHGAQAPWGGPYWFRMFTQEVGSIGFALFMVGAVALVYLLAVAKDRKFLPLLFVFAWVMFFEIYLFSRVNLVHEQYAMPVIPAFIIIAAFGLMIVRTRVASRAGARRAYAAVAAIIVAALALQGFQNIWLYTYLGNSSLTTSLSPENQVIGRWYTECVPVDARVFPAPYSYVPPAIEAVWFRTQGYQAFMQFNPNLVMVSLRDAKTFLEAPELTSAAVLGVAEDTAQFYRIVTRSDAFVTGPQFEGNRVYLTPELAKAVAARGPKCLHP